MIRIFAFLAVLAVPLIWAAGCTQSQTREQTQTEKVDKVTISGAIPMQGPSGIVQVPVAFTIDRTGTEQRERQAETKAGIDGEAIGRSIAAAIAPVISAAVASTGVPWAQILGGAGTAVVAATTGYLAIAKRGQVKRGENKP